MSATQQQQVEDAQLVKENSLNPSNIAVWSLGTWLIDTYFLS
jgi:hypothetical protein